MAKKKKITEKLLTFYRGPKRKPAKIADEDEIKIIHQTLEECLYVDRRNCSYCFNWNELCHIEPNTKFIITAGLKSGLRCLKQRRTLALIYDDQINPHIIKYLNEYANKLNFPIIQAYGLSVIASKLKLHSLSLVSIVKDVSGDEELYEKPGHIRPKSYTETPLPESLNNLCKFIQKSHDFTVDNKFRLPNVERVPSTGKSKAKKEARRKLKKLKTEV